MYREYALFTRSVRHVPTESALNVYSGLDSRSPAWDRQGMRIVARRAERQAMLVFALAALAASVVLGVFACRGPSAADGAGGQSGDEGRSPHRFADGAGGGAAELP
jgi:hypothetical protein